MHDSHVLAVAALVTWLLAESLGLVMLRGWIASGAARQRRTRPDGMSLPVLLGHAGLAFTGFLCWVSFLASHAVVAGWLAVGFMAPAIGLGISTVTVWTPYPGPRAGHGQHEPAAHERRPDTEQRSGVIPDELVTRALRDEAMTSKLVDELLYHNLDLSTAPRRSALDVRTLIPLAHGVLAIATFLLATLAAVTAS
jgi:hypothetical protein